jgi:hypothetical protein
VTRTDTFVTVIGSSTVAVEMVGSRILACDDSTDNSTVNHTNDDIDMAECDNIEHNNGVNIARFHQHHLNVSKTVNQKINSELSEKLTKSILNIIHCIRCTLLWCVSGYNPTTN